MPKSTVATPRTGAIPPHMTTLHALLFFAPNSQDVEAPDSLGDWGTDVTRSRGFPGLASGALGYEEEGELGASPVPWKLGAPWDPKWLSAKVNANGGATPRVA